MLFPTYLNGGLKLSLKREDCAFDCLKKEMKIIFLWGREIQSSHIVAYVIRIYEVRSGDGKSAPTITRDRGWPNGEMWRLIWSFHGLLMLALLGVGLLFIVFLSPTQRLKLFGEENYFVVQVAASYMFSV